MLNTLCNRLLYRSFVPLQSCLDYFQFTESEYEKVVLVPCNVCGRKFKADRLAKHKSVCTKMAGKKRKVYNMENARRKGTDLEQFRIVKGSSRDPPVQAAV